MTSYPPKNIAKITKIANGSKNSNTSLTSFSKLINKKYI